MYFIKRVLIFICCFILLISCKSVKTVSGSNTADLSVSTSSIIASHQAASATFKTLASRALVVYKDEKKEQSITVSLRMEKDNIIWIKAAILGVTIAKVLITPEKVSYYETLGNTYFEGDYKLISDFLGTELNFSKAQAILLGQSIFDLNQKKYVSSVKNKKYHISPKLMPTGFPHQLILNPDTYKVYHTLIEQPKEARRFELTYGPYQEIEGSYYPTVATIISKENKERQSQVSIKYKKIDINAVANFPFKIPEGYKKIELLP